MTKEELIEFLDLKWIEDKGVYEGSHGYTSAYDHSGWGQEDKVLMQRDLFDSKEAIGNILLLLADKVKQLEDSHRDNVDESFPHVKK